MKFKFYSKDFAVAGDVISIQRAIAELEIVTDVRLLSKKTLDNWPDVWDNGPRSEMTEIDSEVENGR